jgi:choline dehydrogenase-like flavoprotein
MLPGTFRLGAAGADAHYAGTLPMREHPQRTETDRDGALAALPGVYVADASALPVLPGKAHTLSMMACADRLGRGLAARLCAKAT